MARSPRYLGHVLRGLLALFEHKPAITRAEFEAALATARGRSGGEQRGENFRAPQAAAPQAEAPGVLAYDAWSGGVVRLDGDASAPVPGGAISAAPAGPAYEDLCEAVDDALAALYGQAVAVEATYPDHVVFGLGGPDGGARFSRPYRIDDAAGALAWGALAKLADQPPAPAGTPNTPNPDLTQTANVPVGLAPDQEAEWRAAWQAAFDACMADGGQDSQRCKAAAQAAADDQMTGITGQGSDELQEARDDTPPKSRNASGSMNTPGNGDLRGTGMPKMDDTVALAGSTEKPWNGAASKYPDTASYCDASLVNDNTGPRDGWTQDKCHIPIREPNGDINLNALRAAASALAGGRTGSPPPYAAEGKRKLEPLLRRYKIGDYAEGSGSSSMDAPAGVRLEGAADAQLLYTVASIRLADDEGTIPAWQQLHKIGEWAEPHTSGMRIKLTREMGNALVRNFHAGVVRRDIPLDMRHGTDVDGVALGWLRDVRWGSPGQGLPSGPEPDGQGSILYGKFAYNALGHSTLCDRQYAYISPQYDLDYVDKESGRKYGPAFVAVGSTNNPFLRQRSIHGQEAPAPVVLSDGLTGLPVKEAPMPETETRVVELTDRVQALEAQIRAQKDEAHRVDVQHFLDEQVRAGLPPALADTFRRIMLQTSPEADGVIRLSDAPEEAPGNLYAALRGAVGAIPKMPLGRVTLADEQRPPNGDGPADQQVGAAVDRLMHHAGKTRTPHPSGGSGLPTSTNGTH